jgi:hypothetical protein
MRTDSVARPSSHFNQISIEVVPADFARQLERELETALQVISKQEEKIKDLKQQYDAASIMLNDFDPQSLL